MFKWIYSELKNFVSIYFNASKNTSSKGKIDDLTLSNLSILKTGKAKAIRFSTLEAICKALDCQPGDILEYVEDI